MFLFGQIIHNSLLEEERGCAPRPAACPQPPRAPRGQRGDPALLPPCLSWPPPSPGSAAGRRLINQFVSRTARFVRLTIARCKWQPLASSSERLLIKIWQEIFCVLKNNKIKNTKNKKMLGFSTLPFQALIYSRLPVVCDPPDKSFVRRSGPIRRRGQRVLHPQGGQGDAGTRTEPNQCSQCPQCHVK